MNVAIVHDYLTQRGGAERVVLSMLKAFPGAAVHTSLYDPGATYPAFALHDVRPSPLSRVGALRRDHRRALPFLAWSFARLRVDADVVVCSSSGWSHGVRTAGHKVVYCYTPARWLYQTKRYLRESSWPQRAAMVVLRPALRRWDQRSAASADRYLTSSTAVRERIARTYGIDAMVVPPCHTIDHGGERRPVVDVEPGFLLCVSRLQPYKNVDAVISAFGRLAPQRLVVVGTGPDEARLQAMAGPNTRLVGAVDDAELRWLYANCAGVVAASHEDFGLTPLEAAVFGRPSAVLRWGGFVDTVVEGSTGVFFDRARPAQVAAAVERLKSRRWDAEDLRAHARRYGEDHFVDAMRSLVAEELAAR